MTFCKSCNARNPKHVSGVCSRCRDAFAEWGEPGETLDQWAFRSRTEFLGGDGTWARVDGGMVVRRPKSLTLEHVVEYRELMIRTAARYIHDVELAEDLVQELSVKVINGEYKAVVPRAWLVQLTKWAAKKRYKQLKVEFPTDNMDLFADDEDLGKIESGMDVDALLDSLPPRYGEALRLFMLEGYSHADLADHLGVTVIASQELIRRAKLALKRVLKLK